MAVAEAPPARAKNFLAQGRGVAREPRPQAKPAAELSRQQLEQWLLTSRFAVRRDDGSLEITPLGLSAAEWML